MKKVMAVMVSAVLLAATAHAEFQRLQMTVFGMD
jgi:hypothetical protein